MESLQFEAIIENELFSKDLRSLAAPNQRWWKGPLPFCSDRSTDKNPIALEMYDMKISFQLFCQGKGHWTISIWSYFHIAILFLSVSLIAWNGISPFFYKPTLIPHSANAESQSNFCISGGHYDAMMAKFPHGFFFKDKRLANKCPTPQKKILSCIVHIAVIHSQKER